MAERTRQQPADPTIDFDPLTGRVVRLRELREDDLPTLVEWWNDPTIGAFQRPTVHPQTAGGVVEMFRTWCRNDGPSCGFCVTRRKGGELIGHAALFGATPKDRCATFGIFLGPEHQNRGYGSDAVQLMVRYGFVELGLHRIELQAFAFNPRAIAAYEKAGFVVEGRRRQTAWRSGGWHDDVMMGLLADEWAAARPG